MQHTFIKSGLPVGSHAPPMTSSNQLDVLPALFTSQFYANNNHYQRCPHATVTTRTYQQRNPT